MKDFSNWIETKESAQYTNYSWSSGYFMDEPAKLSLESPLQTKYYRGIKVVFVERIGRNTKKHFRYILKSINGAKFTNESCSNVRTIIDKMFSRLENRLQEKTQSVENDILFLKRIKTINDTYENGYNESLASLLINARYNRLQTNWVLNYLVKNTKISKVTILNYL